MTDNSKHEVTSFIEKYVLGRGILIKYFNEEDVRLIILTIRIKHFAQILKQRADSTPIGSI